MEQAKHSPEEAPEVEPKQVYLEIGPGLDPSALGGNRTFEGNKIYIGVDSAKGDYKTLAGGEYGPAIRIQLAEIQSQVTETRTNENIHFVFGDGGNLPLQDNSVAEVYMANVLTAPQWPSLRVGLLKEVNRVIQHGGDLIVKVSWDAWLSPQDEITQMLTDAGFELVTAVSAKEDRETFENLEETYGKTKGIDEPVGYYLIAHKPI